MTIGPAPMIMIEAMSVRLGIRYFLLATMVSMKRSNR